MATVQRGEHFCECDVPACQQNVGRRPLFSSKTTIIPLTKLTNFGFKPVGIVLYFPLERRAIHIPILSFYLEARTERESHRPGDLAGKKNRNLHRAHPRL